MSPTLLLKKCIIGFSYGIPFPLTIVILDYWLKDCGIANLTIGLFSVFHLPFALKLLFAPIIDECRIPYLSKLLGHRRSWAFVSQLALTISVMCMAQVNPTNSLFTLMCFASVAALADGVQNISLYPYQISDITEDQFGYTAGMISFGHRIGTIVTKVTTLYCAHFWGWKIAYECAACLILFCMVFIFFMKEPVIAEGVYHANRKNVQAFSSPIKKIFKEMRQIIRRSDGLYVILTLLLYKASDFTIQKMSRVFCLEIGFSKLEIANIVQIFGSVSVVLGGFLAGFFIKKRGTLNSMIFFSIMHMSFLFCYVVLNRLGNDTDALCTTVFLEGLTGGAVAAAFIAFLYEECKNGSQYALLWAIHELGGMIFRLASGFLADMCDWAQFFMIIPWLSVPGILILKRLSCLRREKRETIPCYRD